MTVFPEFEGPMVDWPEVAVEPGAAEMLNGLREEGYQIALATNAQDSSREEIAAALERGGIAKLVDRVFCQRDLGVRKSDPAFYLKIADLLGEQPARLMMVGDDYFEDVLTPWQLGWQTCYYRTPTQTMPRFLNAVQDIEIEQLSQMRMKLNTERLPSFNHSLALLIGERAGMILLQHVQMVAAVAYDLAVRLDGKVAVDPLKTHRGGLLHDVDKRSKRLTTPEDHGLVGAQLLRERGYSEIAGMVAKHQLFRVLEEGNAPETWEEKLVYFADKIVEGNRLMPFLERMKRLEGRYPQNTALIRASTPYVESLQRQICDLIGFEPHDMMDVLHEDLWIARF
ncbi:MAG: HAD hydrolase-like protein [Anaerolineaceae bacterium]|nr:HAD hydrolase-like protein [Anaerolineaceae bacterium]